MSTYAEKNWGDCSEAVAYSLNFVQMCYVSGAWGRFYDIDCDECEHDIQVKSFEYPKGSFSKKDYYILDMLVYGVSEKLKNDIITFGISEDLFRPIYTKKHDVVLGYQIVPKNILPLTYKENGMYEYSKCKKCGNVQYERYNELAFMKVYNDMDFPVYINQDALRKLEHINALGEYPENSVIISLDLYNYLIKKYPRLECRPVYVGSVYEDKEYLKEKSK